VGCRSGLCIFFIFYYNSVIFCACAEKAGRLKATSQCMFFFSPPDRVVSDRSGFRPGFRFCLWSGRGFPGMAGVRRIWAQDLASFRPRFTNFGGFRIRSFLFVWSLFTFWTEPWQCENGSVERRGNLLCTTQTVRLRLHLFGWDHLNGEVAISCLQGVVVGPLVLFSSFLLLLFVKDSFQGFLFCFVKKKIIIGRT
jgi:hypothetical protein